MSLTARATGGTEMSPIDAGVHLAVCYGIYDLGTHHDDMYGKDRHQVVFLWEVPDSRIELERDGKRVNLPRAISQKYTLSLSEKANLLRDLQSWMGRPFTADELDGFDLRNVLGKSCQLNIVHASSKDGTKIYANIAAIMGLPRGVHPLSLENEIQWFSFEEGVTMPAAAPEWIREYIAKSREYMQASQQAHDAPRPAPASDEEPHYTAEDEPATLDDIPF